MKVSKETVGYSPGHQSSHCGQDGRFGATGSCRHYQGGGACEVVAGSINPDYWCRRWLHRVTMAGLGKHVGKKA